MVSVAVAVPFPVPCGAHHIQQPVRGDVTSGTQDSDDTSSAQDIHPYKYLYCVVAPAVLADCVIQQKKFLNVTRLSHTVRERHRSALHHTAATNNMYIS